MDIPTITPVPPPTNLRTCRQCFAPKPLTEFRPTLGGGAQRSTLCNFCHAQRERERRASNRAGKHRRRFSAFAKSIIAMRDRKRVEYLAQAMVQSYGGTHRFLAAWIENYLQAPGGSLARMSMFRAVFRMVEFLSDPPPVDEDNVIPPMTEKELQRELAESWDNHIRSNPADAAKALRRRGWTVLPPGGQGGDCTAVPEETSAGPSATATAGDVPRPVAG